MYTRFHMHKVILLVLYFMLFLGASWGTKVSEVFCIFIQTYSMFRSGLCLDQGFMGATTSVTKLLVLLVFEHTLAFYDSVLACCCTVG